MLSMVIGQDDSTCLCIKFASKVAPTEIKFSDVYAVELINYGVIHGPNVSNARRCLKALRVNVTMRFTALRCMVSRAQGLCRLFRSLLHIDLVIRISTYVRYGSIKSMLLWT